MIDPTCAFHGRKRSEHVCVVCCLCFKELADPNTGETYADIYVDEDGQKWDKCLSCVAHEELMMEELNA